MATMKSPLLFTKGEEHEDPQKNARYIMLGYFVCDEDDDELKIWEEFENRKIMFDYLKQNYTCLHLLKSKVYKVYLEPNSKDCIASIKSTGKTVYDVIKQLQGVFGNFDIDEEIDIESYKYDL